MGQMVYCVMMALVYVLVRTMLLVTNVPNVQQDIGTFLHVKIVPVIRMDLLTVLVIPQVGSVHVLIMLVGINVMLVQLDGMISQAVKNVFVTLLVLWILVVPMMPEFVHVTRDIQGINVIPVLMVGL